MCDKRDMGVMSLEKIVESDAVTDILADLGETKINLVIFDQISALGLSSKTVLTSLNKIGGGGDFSWASGLLADFVNWAPDQPKKDAGDCTGLLELVVSVIPCDTVANFMCEDKGINITRMKKFLYLNCL